MGSPAIARVTEVDADEGPPTIHFGLRVQFCNLDDGRFDRIPYRIHIRSRRSNKIADSIGEIGSEHHGVHTSDPKSVAVSTAIAYLPGREEMREAVAAEVDNHLSVGVGIDHAGKRCRPKRGHNFGTRKRRIDDGEQLIDTMIVCVVSHHESAGFECRRR